MSAHHWHVGSSYHLASLVLRTCWSTTWCCTSHCISAHICTDSCLVLMMVFRHQDTLIIVNKQGGPYSLECITQCIWTLLLSTNAAERLDRRGEACGNVQHPYSYAALCEQVIQNARSHSLVSSVQTNRVCRTGSSRIFKGDAGPEQHLRTCENYSGTVSRGCASAA